MLVETLGIQKYLVILEDNINKLKKSTTKISISA